MRFQRKGGDNQREPTHKFLSPPLPYLARNRKIVALMKSEDIGNHKTRGGDATGKERGGRLRSNEPQRKKKEETPVLCAGAEGGTVRGGTENKVLLPKQPGLKKEREDRGLE